MSGAVVVCVACARQPAWCTCTEAVVAQAEALVGARWTTQPEAAEPAPVQAPPTPALPYTNMPEAVARAGMHLADTLGAINDAKRAGCLDGVRWRELYHALTPAWEAWRREQGYDVEACVAACIQVARGLARWRPDRVGYTVRYQQAGGVAPREVFLVPTPWVGPHTPAESRAIDQAVTEDATGCARRGVPTGTVTGWAVVSRAIIEPSTTTT